MSHQAAAVFLAVVAMLMAGLSPAQAADTTVTGRVVDSAGVAQELVYVTLGTWDDSVSDEHYEDGVDTDSSGRFTFAGVSTGKYRLVVNDDSESNQLSVVRQVTISSLGTVDIGDVVRREGGRIAGTATERDSGAPVANAGITIYDDEGNETGYGHTDDDGAYVLNGLDTGSYRVLVVDEFGLFRRQYFSDASSLATATPIAVVAGRTAGGKNFSLRTASSISGTISVPSGTDRAAYVAVYRADGDVLGENDQVGSSYSEDGTYMVNGLDPGSYKLSVEPDDSQLAPEYFNNSTTFADATVISVADGQAATGRNVSLERAGLIEGRVSVAAGGFDPNGSSVESSVQVVDRASGEIVKEESAVDYDDDIGSYRIGGLRAGSYRVEFARQSGTASKAAQFYNGKPESAGPQAADSVTVTAGADTSNIDAILKEGGQLVGVIENENGDPLEGVEMRAYTATGSLVTRGARTDEAGQFDIGGLSTGSYRLSANLDSVEDERYFTGHAFLNPDSSAGITIPVTLGSTRTLAQTLILSSDKPAVNTKAPAITGSAVIGQTLTATTGTWSPSGLTFAYAWKRNGSVVAGATAATYKPVAADVGKALTVTVTASAPDSEPISKESAPTALVKAPPVVNTAVPKITGMAQVGQTLTTSDGSWSTAGLTFTRQWFRAGVVIAGATASSYKPVAADVGKALSMKLTGARTGYVSSTVGSAPTATVVAPVITNTKAPTIVGAAGFGKKLAASAGTWSQPGTVFAYQWLRNGVVITGATSSSYTPGTEDLGKQVSVRVVARKSGFVSSASKDSAKTAAVKRSSSVKVSGTVKKKKVRLKVTLKVTGISKPGGKVVIKEGSKKIKSSVTVKKGVATYSFTAKKGSRTYTVTYAGSSTIAASKGTKKVKIK